MRGGRRITPLGSGIAALALVGGISVSACGGEVDEADASRSDGEAACELPLVTGIADYASYPASLHELVAQADVVVEGRVVGEAGPALADRQPMTFDVDEVFAGDVDAGGSLTVQRRHTTYSITGSTEQHHGRWADTPWYCPGERYVLFLRRDSAGELVALQGSGAVRIGSGRTHDTISRHQVQATLAGLEPDELRSRIRDSVARSAGD